MIKTVKIWPACRTSDIFIFVSVNDGKKENKTSREPRESRNIPVVSLCNLTAHSWHGGNRKSEVACHYCHHSKLLCTKDGRGNAECTLEYFKRDVLKAVVIVYS